VEDLLQPAVSKDDITLLQKMFGLIVLGVNRPQRIWILSGAPNTGKTTLGRLITHLIGHWNYAELRTEHLSGRFETSRALGKTLLFGPDVKSHFLESDGAYRLKSLVGGDPLNAERKCSNQDFPFFGDLNVLITSNARLLVRLEGDVGAWLRRLVIIVYNGTPPAKRIDRFVSRGNYGAVCTLCQGTRVAAAQNVIGSITGSRRYLRTVRHSGDQFRQTQ
jgi:putative DNA primase/helicase